MLMFADEIKKQANGLGISENSSIIENLYLDSMLNMLFLEVSATAAGAGVNNRMLLRRMLMKEGQICSLKISLLMPRVKGSLG